MRTIKMRNPIRQAKGRDTYDCLADASEILGGNVTFGTHIRGQEVTVADTGLINTTFAVSHSLGYIPTKFFVFGKDQAGDIYRAGVPWTEKQIFLKCNIAHVTNLILFIL